MLSDNVTSSSSPWATSAALVPKKDNKSRFSFIMAKSKTSLVRKYI